tara:strand:+ start:694 stop:1734 length:1041 start_codon:yes stop_codon:yes gene_type:complete
MSSIIKVDTIQDQNGNNIINENANTVTVGKAGDTVNIVGTLQNNGAELTGDISSVVAGTGLSGGGTTGDVTLNIEAAQPTVTSTGTLTSFRSTGIDDNSNALAMTINSSEQVGIGTTSPSCALDINGGSVNGNVFKTTTSGDNNYLAIDNTSTGGVEWVLNSSGNGSGNGGGNFAIQGPDSNTVRVMVHSNGVTAFNNGIALGVGTANTASNVLDDYEEGTWSPAFGALDGLAGGINYTTQEGFYTKVGRLVTFSFFLRCNGTPNGNRVTLVGLPFTNGSSSIHGMYFSYLDSSIINSTSTNPPVPHIPKNSTSMLWYKTNGTDFVGTDLADASDIQIYMNGFYYV